MRSSLIADTSNLDSAHDDSTFRIVLWPAAIAIAVTVLRAVGELNRWPKPLVNSAPCGKAILGVTWLVPLVGAYFVFKLARAHERPTQLRFTFVAALVGLALKLAGTYLLESGKYSYGIRITGDFVLTAVGMALPALTWPPLFKLLLAYGYASRIPVAIVQWLALRGHWGTHYDALGNFPPIGFWPTYIRVSLVPNIFFMEAYTVIVGALVGTAALAILEAIKQKST